MSAMSDEIQLDPKQNYSIGQVAKIVGLSDRHVVRLVDLGLFPGSFRKSPVPRSPRVVPGKAIIEFLALRKK
jgi:hypothetical protein